MDPRRTGWRNALSVQADRAEHSSLGGWDRGVVAQDLLGALGLFQVHLIFQFRHVKRPLNAFSVVSASDQHRHRANGAIERSIPFVFDGDGHEANFASAIGILLGANTLVIHHRHPNSCQYS